jgi:ubiquinone/menaquinone biosynthesis C-methylase UbiE
MLDIKMSWDKIASLYNRKYLIKTDTVHYGPLCPGEDKLHLLGRIAGLKAVDLGCGGGQNAIAMATMGALVTAVDFSVNQLAEAETLARREAVSIEFVNSDMTHLPALKPEAFDIVLSACAMAFVRKLGAALAESYRILKNGGKFVMSVMHPLQYILDGEKGRMYFNSAFPFNPRLLKWSWDFPEKSVNFEHYLRSVSEYHNCLVEAGFVVKRILEPKPTLKTPHIGFSKEIMKEYPYVARHLPIVLIIVSEKPASTDGEGRHG